MTMNFKLFRILYGISFAFWLLSFYFVYFGVTHKFSTSARPDFSVLGQIVLCYFTFLAVSVLLTIMAEYFRKRSFKSIFSLMLVISLSVCLSGILLPFLTYHLVKLINWQFVIHSNLVGIGAPPLAFIWFSSIGIPTGITIWLIIDRKKGEPKDRPNRWITGRSSRALRIEEILSRRDRKNSKNFKIFPTGLQDWQDILLIVSK